jgi:hypothetical protein
LHSTTFIWCFVPSLPSPCRPTKQRFFSYIYFGMQDRANFLQALGTCTSHKNESEDTYLHLSTQWLTPFTHNHLPSCNSFCFNFLCHSPKLLHR